MNYNIDTEEGMANAAKWMRMFLARFPAPTMIWFIPRSSATYTIHKPSKTYSSTSVDEPTERVLSHMGYSKARLQ